MKDPKRIKFLLCYINPATIKHYLLQNLHLPLLRNNSPFQPLYFVYLPEILLVECVLLLENYLWSVLVVLAHLK